MKKLSPQQNQIVSYLSDGEWRCMASADFYMKDDRTRISELRRIGYEIDGKPCDRRCGVRHSSNVFMRKLVKVPNPQIALV